MKTLIALLVLLAACDPSPGVVAPTLERAEPPYAALGGGSQVILRGAGFAPAPNRVYIGGREAPLVRKIDDTQLGVVVPPGDTAGDVEVVVLNRNGNAIATGLLRYSTPPAITSTSPARVLYTSDTTRITLTGSGFQDEGAGTVEVLVDGSPVLDVDVASDTELSFTAPPGRALVRPELTVIDSRGSATTHRGFRYAPSEHDGLLLFSSFSSSFAVFVDPIAMEVVPIPWVTNQAVRYTAVVRDDLGDYWALDRSQHFGRIDMTAQAIEDPITVSTLIPSIARAGSDLLAIDRITRQVGSLDPATGAFTRLSTATLTCCGSFGIAPLGATVYVTSRDATGIAITPIDPQSGALGTPVPLTGGPVGLHIEEMRAFGGVLYATSRTGQLVSIDPATGAVTVLPISPGRASAMDIFD